MVAKDHILASINSRKFPTLAKEIDEFKANPQNNLSELVNIAVKKELDARRPKIESYVFDDDDGQKQKELETLKFPPIDDPEALRQSEFWKRFYTELTPTEQGRAIRRCYISHDILKEIHFRRAHLLNDSLIITEEEEQRMKAQDKHHDQYHSQEIEDARKGLGLDGTITVCEKYKDVCHRCLSLYEPSVRERDYKAQEAARLKAEFEDPRIR
jgi:hypothetical protein